MSWGSDENSSDPAFDSHFTTPSGHNGVTFVASSGDDGAYSQTGSVAMIPQWPAVSPNVVGVGGTTLTTGADGSYISESGWGNATSSFSLHGSGGGISQYESQPAYQQSVVTQSSTMRCVPDVAMDADPNSGVPVYDSYDFGTSTPWIQVGGTSLAAPMFAGLIALANQGRALNKLGTLDGPTGTLPTLYALPASAFHDITSGNNGYAAGPGYDLVTGRGSPIANLLVNDLVPATFTVTNTLDDGSNGSLPWAILQADNTTGAALIAFDSSIFSSAQTITLTSSLPALTNSVLATTIQGPGASLLTIDGMNQYQIFTIDSGTKASLSGLTIRCGSAVTGSGNGGGIDNAGLLTVSSCTLSGNSATSDGGGIWDGGTLTATNCIFNNNSATGNGGGIWDGGPLTAIDCTFNDNSATGDGGGLCNQGSSLALTTCTIGSNSAQCGAGIENGGTLTVTNCTLTGNSATDLGGGISNPGTLTVTDGTFTGNSASNGGSIDNAGTLTVTNSTFTGNSASNGGSIDNGNFSTLTLTNSTLSGNSATSNGGGIDNAGTLTATNCTLTRNSAIGDGGGIDNAGTLTATNCTFTGNSADNGGSIDNGNSSTLTLTNSTLRGNSATGNGGSIDNAGTLTVTTCTLKRQLRHQRRRQHRQYWHSDGDDLHSQRQLCHR